MTNLIWLILIFSPLLKAQPLTVMVGEQKKISGKFINATLTNPSVLALTKSRGGYVLIGKKPGEAFLKIGGKAPEKVVVYSAKLETAKHDVENLVENSSYLSFQMTPTKIIVSGSIEKVQEWVSLVQLTKIHSRFIQWQPSATDEVLTAIKEKIKNELRSRGVFSASVEKKNQTLQIYTSGKTPVDKRSAIEISKEWGLDIPETSSSVELRPMVEIEITIAEIKKNSLKSLGISIPGSYSATVLPDLQWNPLVVTLKTQIENQLGKVIASPKLLCRSGEVAHFVAGGEIPIKLMNWKTTDVVWKKYGVLLDITPLADMQNGISTKLVTEISLIDEAHKVDNIPGFLTNRIDTHFDLRGEKTIVLSGLIKNELGRGSQDTPLLSAIPLLGELFKSRDYKENKTELIVMVTPRVVSPENPRAPDKNGFWNNDL